MCDLTMIMGIGSSLLGAFGQIQEAHAQNEMAKYNAQISRMNAEMADRRAQDALERGKEEENRKQREVAQVIGRQRAGMAANGLDVSFGSPLDLIVDTAVQGELDALTIKKNAYREEQDYRQQAWNYRAQGDMQRMAGKNAKRQGYWQAAGTIMGGAGKAMGSAGSGGIGSFG